MSKKQIIKLLCLNLGIALLNVILFSAGFVGLNFSGDALTTALGVTVIVMSIVTFFYGNYTILFKQPSIQLFKNAELVDDKDYIGALEERREKKVFDEEISNAIDQVYRLQDKDKALDSILAQYFSPQEMTYTKFQTVIDSVQALFYNNLKKMINRMIIFDYKDYTKLINKLKNAPASDGITVASKSTGAQLKIYNEHIDYVKGLVEMNESILVKLDSLLLEISKLDDIDEAGLEELTAIQEINDLISQAKSFKT